MCFKDFFIQNNNIHQHLTRNNELKLYASKFKTYRYGKDSIKYQCITDWNNSITKLKELSLKFYKSTILDLKKYQLQKILRLLF